MSAVLDKARALARDGLPVFPLLEDKSPACAGGFKAATTDEARIRELFGNPAAALIGVPTGAVSGFDVVDIDRHKPAGEQWLKENSFKIPPAARLQRTRSGGWHAFFKHHEGMRSSADNPAKGVDVRADGGYIVWWHGEPGCELLRDGAIDGCEWPEALLDPVLAKKPAREESGPAKRPDELSPPDADTLIQLLLALPNPADTDRDTYVALGMATQGCIRGLAALEKPTEGVADAWADWAARWEHPNAGSFEAELAKFNDDFGQRTEDLAGWRQVLGIAHRLGMDTTPYRDPAGFDPLPEPEPTPEPGGFWDPWETPAPPSFPMHVLPTWLQDVAYDTHESMGCSLDGVAMAYLAGIAGAIHGLTRVKAMKHHDWREAARLWVAFIGDPSTRKSPLMNRVMKPYTAAKKRAMEAYRFTMATWETTEKQQRGEKPIPPAIYTNNSTPEAIVEMLSAANRGVTIFADELSDWLGNMERYATKGTSYRPFWLQAFNGGPYYENRIGRGATSVANLSVPIIGGIQMDRLQRLVGEQDLTDDGLLQRFLPVFMQPAKPPKDQPPKVDPQLYDNHVTQLLELGQRAFELDNDGYAIRVEAEHHYNELMTADLIGKAYTGWLGKAPGFLLRLAVALHMSDPEALGDEAKIIQAATVQKAADLMEFFTGSAWVLYTQLDETMSDYVPKIAEWLLLQRKNVFTLGDFGAGPRCCRGISEPKLRSRIWPLISGRWLIPDNDYPTCSKWQMPVGLRQRFLERAKVAAEKREKLTAYIKATSRGNKAA